MLDTPVSGCLPPPDPASLHRAHPAASTKSSAYPNVLDEAEDLHDSSGAPRRAVVRDDIVVEVGVHPLANLLAERRDQAHAFH